MPQRTTRFYALLLLLPTVIVGGVLARLLVHERERLAHADALAVEAQARSVASEVLVAIDGLRDSILRRLAELPATNTAALLSAWQQRDPLVRNVFMVDAARGVVLPDAARGLTREEEAFLQRFRPLLDGEVAWQSPPQDQPPGRPLMTQNLRPGASASVRQASGGEVRSGWLPWFVGRNLHLLAWVRRPDGARIGLEVEMGSLLSRLIPAFPAQVPAGRTLALLDGQGAVVHSVGAEELRPSAPRLAVLSLAPDLPHWQIVVAGRAGGRAGNRLLFTLVAVICAILMIGILGGGWLLVRDARRSQIDALTRTTFVANVSHELKTPLTTIRMYAELLGEGRVPDEARRIRYLDTIVQEAGRLTRLIDNVLDFSRIDRGRKVYRPEALDLAGEVRRIVEGQAERLRAAGLSVELAGCDAPCRVRTDRDALEQVLLNLLDNAAKYGAAGRRLAVGVFQAGSSAGVCVRDWGPGVPPALVKRLFQQFQRGDDTLTTRHPGCGLGLSISRRLLRDQGGDLAYEPAAGGGACFALTLPRAMEEEDEGKHDTRG